MPDPIALPEVLFRWPGATARLNRLTSSSGSRKSNCSVIASHDKIASRDKAVKIDNDQSYWETIV
jgi:hypothetical protein